MNHFVHDDSLFGVVTVTLFAGLTHLLPDWSPLQWLHALASAGAIAYTVFRFFRDIKNNR